VDRKIIGHVNKYTILIHVFISIPGNKIICVYVCVFCVSVCVNACEIELTELIYMEFYKDFPKAICGITVMDFIYKFTVTHFVYGLYEHNYHSISPFIISMRN
jgi:hypothetical protein